MATVAVALAGGEKTGREFHELATELQEPTAAADLRRVCERLQMCPEMLAELVLARLSRLEPGDNTQSCIRRELYSAMIRTAMLQDGDALQGFLEADYRRVLGLACPSSNARGAPVTACRAGGAALVQLPVIYVFDNMEGLLAPAGNLQPRRAAAFLEEIAQAINQTRGFLFYRVLEPGVV